jgi:two-component system, sensor histidine kinase
VDADRQRLEQAFLNLLTNAIKYTPRGGSVRVTVRQNEDSAVVEVTDSGIGLADGMRSRVFDPFAQVDTALNRAEGGLGLGLAIVRAVVGLHGGTVEALSEGLGRGSSFVVRLPRLDAGATPTPLQAESRMQTKKRILLVEDSEDIRELFTEIMSGHDVACAEEGPEGLDKILTWGPDVAFVDIGLPGFDGFEVARRARERGFTGRLVALTGYGQAADRRRALQAGFDDHLIKPVLGADIERALQRTEA